MMFSVQDPSVDEVVMVAYSDKRRRNGTKTEIMYHQFSGASTIGHCRFTAVIKLLAFLMMGRRVTTKRDFYYQDVELFGRNPEVAYRVVDVVLKAMNLQQRIVAGQKGLVYGNYEVQIVEAEKLAVESLTVENLEAGDLAVDEMTAVGTGGVPCQALSSELLGLGDTKMGGVDVSGSAASAGERLSKAEKSEESSTINELLDCGPVVGPTVGPRNRPLVRELPFSTFYGSISLAHGPTEDPSSVPIGLDSDPVLIPRFSAHALSSPSSQPHAIVIIEKEAVFRCFCDHIKLNPSLYPPLLVVTGKGFPDNLTKQFVTSVHHQHPSVPLLGFVDSDVYGLNILRSYQFYRQNYIPVQHAGVNLLHYSHGWLNISSLDHKLMISLLKKLGDSSTSASSIDHHPWHRELTRGLLLRKKSEMNITDCNAYIGNKLQKSLRRIT